MALSFGLIWIKKNKNVCSSASSSFLQTRCESSRQFSPRVSLYSSFLNSNSYSVRGFNLVTSIKLRFLFIMLWWRFGFSRKVSTFKHCNDFEAKKIVEEGFNRPITVNRQDKGRPMEGQILTLCLSEQLRLSLARVLVMLL